MQRMPKPPSITVRLSFIEYMAAFVLLLWGVWLINLPDPYATKYPYAELSERIGGMFGSETLSIPSIGIYGVSIAIFYAIAIFINGRGLYWTPFIRGLGALSGALFFSYLSMGAQLADIYSAGFPTFGAISGCFFILFYLNLERIWDAFRAIRYAGDKWAT